MAAAATAVIATDEKGAVPADATTQLSYSGTPRYRGETRPDEYVKDLADPVKRMELFDEMRSSDESVATALHAREQMIGSSNWMLSSADDKPASREILEFCEDNIYPMLGDLLRNLSGAIQYGFGACETVFEWSDRPFARNIVRGKLRRATKQSGRRIYLRKLAHIRQRTIFSFMVPETGDLEALRQYVYTGTSFRKTDIPADKVLLWTLNRRGDDYWGYPPTRNCYRAWKFKQQLEKINLLGIDRFGVGTPVAEEGEGWSEPDRQRLHDFMSAWRSGQNTFLAHPFGGKVTIQSPQGAVFVSVLEWVKFYGVGIAKTFLTQLSELGTTDTGSRAVGESFSDQLEGVVQSDCEDIANIINERLIPRLVDWNFGPQESYPVFAPSARLQIDAATAQMINTLKQSGAVAWDAQDEQWLRDATGMHEIDVKTRQGELDEKKLQAEELAKQLPAAQPQRALPPGTPEKKDPAKVPLRALSYRESDPAPVEASTIGPLRTIEYSEWEARVLRPEILSRDLDLEQVRLTGEVQDVLRAIDLSLRNAAEDLAQQGPEVIAANIRNVAVSNGLKQRLRKAMLTAALRIRAYGSNAVYSEIARQETGDVIGPTRTPRSALRRFALDVREAMLASDPSPEELRRNMAIAAEIDRAVEDEVDRRESSVRNSLLTSIQIVGSLGVARFASIVRQAIQQALESLSPARTEDNVGGVINVAFGVGRADATSEIVAAGSGSGGAGGGSGVVGHISDVAKVYSAVMDGGTCDECAKWDAAQFPIDYPEDVTGVQAPNPRCHGTYKRCRCVWILLTDQEMQSTIPSAKGPLEAFA